ncbi:hypothetical protein K0U91_01450 [Chryseobacterium chendengshani]|uniref:hypothetical protein n=1 Tax=Chryseobacterium sp. LJ668 TaxID=2864040 RepID=UPI001C68A14A|nr:hypothetical protein [Chryseobacterium sp. LJ668]MBW8523891.1 hypothetical protein [Chryseobacterium sp. LJ668]QYK16831.1 hypothetical protein K0U91_01450 [Chryseobacterium sp. LJ668]
MSRLYLFFALLLQFCFLFGQDSLKYDKILKIENLKFKNNEIRVYKKYQTSTGLELFRFYQDEKEDWKAEFFETVAYGNNNDIKIRTRKSKLNSFKNFELIWAKILDTNVMYLPKWETFQYKLKKINKNYLIEDGEIYSSTTIISTLDGESFYVKIKNSSGENEINYSNPESYLKKYPDVDELISFQELLHLIRNEFKIFIEN